MSEYRASLAHNLPKLMLIRELDRLTNSVCRPTNDCTGSSGTVPNTPFLNTSDLYIGSGAVINNNLHAGNGSHILFADGHVRHFTADYFPARTWYMSSHCWDNATQQWYNFGPNATSMPEHMIKSIAITP